MTRIPGIAGPEGLLSAAMVDHGANRVIWAYGSCFYGKNPDSAPMNTIGDGAAHILVIDDDRRIGELPRPHL